MVIHGDVSTSGDVACKDTFRETGECPDSGPHPRLGTVSLGKSPGQALKNE